MIIHFVLLRRKTKQQKKQTQRYTIPNNTNCFSIGSDISNLVKCLDVYYLQLQKAPTESPETAPTL